MKLTTYLRAKLSTALRTVIRPSRFLKTARGVIHVGANVGQERAIYSRYGLDVVWIEPIPTVFATLQSSLAEHPNQVALRRLVAEADGIKYTLHVSNMGGVSSSILELAAHRRIWPDIEFTSSIEMESATLPTIIREEGIDIKRFDTLVLDTQGSEMLILRGAHRILQNFRFIQCEVPDFESYVGCCQLPELDAFMSKNGFEQKHKKAFAGSVEVGRYYDILYQRRIGAVAH